MKKILLVFAFFCASAIAVNAQESKSGNVAEIAFETVEHDYGTIKAGDNGTYEFKFTNKGKVPLIITAANGSCGCTVPEWPKEPIKPGATGTIKTTYDTKRIGAFSKTVSVVANTSPESTVLTIKGTVEDVAKTPTVPVKKVEEGAPLENAPGMLKAK